jgi:hypothetical protein
MSSCLTQMSHTIAVTVVLMQTPDADNPVHTALVLASSLGKMRQGDSTSLHGHIIGLEPTSPSLIQMKSQDHQNVQILARAALVPALLLRI